ncbi:MAG: hypothetical protein ACRCZR_09115 [Cetobacterium sp.]
MNKIKFVKTKKNEGSIFTNVNLEKNIYLEYNLLAKELLEIDISKKSLMITALTRIKEVENIELRVKEDKELTCSVTLSIPPSVFDTLDKLAKGHKTSKKIIVETALLKLIEDVKKFGIDE